MLSESRDVVWMKSMYVSLMYAMLAFFSFSWPRPIDESLVKMTGLIIDFKLVLCVLC